MAFSLTSKGLTGDGGGGRSGAGGAGGGEGNGGASAQRHLYSLLVSQTTGECWFKLR